MRVDTCFTQIVFTLGLMYNKDNKHSLNCPLCRESVNILWEKPRKEMSGVSSGSEASYWND